MKSNKKPKPDPLNLLKKRRKKYPSRAEDYELVEIIGMGAHAKVWRAHCKVPTLDQKDVAIKIIDLEMYPSNLEIIRKEIQVMSQSSHPNIVTYHTSFVHNTDLWLVMQLLEGGSIFDIMRFKYPNGFDNEDLIAAILKQVLQGIRYFHKNGQIHRDIKASNILVDKEGHIQIGDFGGSAWMIESGDRRKTRQTFIGTPCWMAPEVLEQLRGYDYKADIWSFGITALELACGRAPFADLPPMKVMILTLEKDPPTLEQCTTKKFSKLFKDMIASCLQKDPTKRPTATQLLKHKFFAKVKQDCVPEVLTGLPSLGERVRQLQALMEKQNSHNTSGDTKRQPSSGWNWDVEGGMTCQNLQDQQSSEIVDSTNKNISNQTVLLQNTTSPQNILQIPKELDQLSTTTVVQNQQHTIDDGLVLSNTANIITDTSNLSISSTESLLSVQSAPSKLPTMNGNDDKVNQILETFDKSFSEGASESIVKHDTLLDSYTPSYTGTPFKDSNLDTAEQLINDSREPSILGRGGEPSVGTSSGSTIISMSDYGSPSLLKSERVVESTRLGRFTVATVDPYSSDDIAPIVDSSDRGSDSSMDKQTTRRSGRNFEIRAVDQEEVVSALKEPKTKTRKLKKNKVKAKKKSSQTTLELLQTQVNILTQRSVEQMDILNKLLESSQQQSPLVSMFVNNKDQMDIITLLAQLEKKISMLMEENKKLKLENTMLKHAQNKEKLRNDLSEIDLQKHRSFCDYLSKATSL